MGISENNQRMRAFVYRSATNFACQELPYSIGAKPHLEEYSIPEDIRKIMDLQRLNERLRPPEERVYIGGEIQVHHLSQDGFTAYTLDRFEDYNQDEETIYQNASALDSSG